MARDVIAIGDVHGDGDRLIHALERLKLAAGGYNDVRWTGGSVSLVLMGDILDGAVRDPQISYHTSVGDLQLVDYLARLADSARANGGEVTCLKGNHEIMNENGIFQYVHPRDRVPGRQSRILQSRFMRTWKRAHSENETLFTHAGVNPERANYVSNIDDVLKLSDYDVMEHRGYADDEHRPQVIQAVRDMLGRGQWKQMVIGHNTVDTPRTTWDGMVVMADAQLSRAYGNDTSHIHVLCVRPWGEWIPIHIPIV